MEPVRLSVCLYLLRMVSHDVRSRLEIWQLEMNTLSGMRSLTLTLTEVRGRLRGHLVGRAWPWPGGAGAGTSGLGEASIETMPVLDLTLDRDRLCWWHRSTHPTALNYRMDVTIVGATMCGSWRAGWLPGGPVVGRRAVPAADVPTGTSTWLPSTRLTTARDSAVPAVRRSHEEQEWSQTTLQVSRDH